MKESLEWIIRHALEDARAKGRDRFTETTLAVRAVCRARLAMTAMKAVTAVCGGQAAAAVGRLTRPR